MASNPTLLELLDDACPDWAEQFASPVEAAVEYGLIEADELDLLHERRPLNFHDEDE